MLKQRAWSMCGEYVRGNKELMHIYIAKELMGLHWSSAELVDHKNQDKLDNRRSNLRVADKSTNTVNGRRRKNTSGFYGVHKLKGKDRWVSHITVNYKTYFIGSFADPLYAAYMRDQWALAIYGDFAQLNVLG